MKSIAELLGEQPLLSSLDPAQQQILAGCGSNRHFATDEYMFREGGSADTFFLVRRGRIALELFSPARGSLVVDTVEVGSVVGWSWLIPPYRWFFDARAVQPTSVVVLDGRCLREKCDADPALGYAVLQRISEVMYHRLQAARVRLLDLYGSSSARTG